ncbi:hypothetical protein KC19_8G027900 [Ceratodon purpureus]|uniref:Uncharacterized protein n=1 Tax=Ceratodon purpureus TaxID=3225 RepID=A0A8T0GUJ3_CERPU|nr:hypothetical protein KC19_8G027900 [Ceratodon purpureus]
MATSHSSLARLQYCAQCCIHPSAPESNPLQLPPRVHRGGPPPSRVQDPGVRTQAQPAIRAPSRPLAFQPPPSQPAVPALVVPLTSFRRTKSRLSARIPFPFHPISPAGSSSRVHTRDPLAPPGTPVSSSSISFWFGCCFVTF